MQVAKEHPWWAALGALFALGMVLTYWHVIAAALGVMAVIEYGRDQRTKRSAILARAEYEHQLEAQGDTRGLYGQYPPSV